MLCIANRNQGILIREGRFRISPTKGESKVGLMMLGKGRGGGCWGEGRGKETGMEEFLHVILYYHFHTAYEQLFESSGL